MPAGLLTELACCNIYQPDMMQQLHHRLAGLEAWVAMKEEFLNLAKHEMRGKYLKISQNFTKFMTFCISHGGKILPNQIKKIAKMSFKNLFSFVLLQNFVKYE